jgi:hypothetical protein
MTLSNTSGLSVFTVYFFNNVLDDDGNIVDRQSQDRATVIAEDLEAASLKIAQRATTYNGVAIVQHENCGFFVPGLSATDGSASD